MSDLAREFLLEWTMKQEPSPLSRHDAIAAAEEWEADALENGVSPAELHAAAGGDLADYLLRTYGEEE